MPSEVQYEAVLIWSHKVDEGRSYKAYNRVFREEPDSLKLQGMIGEKLAEIEADPETFVEPELFRLEIRRVEKRNANLREIVDAYNEAQA